ncbi:MAG: hypothetical protein ACYDHY_07075 [Acidiferrobacterales bacterium]
MTNSEQQAPEAPRTMYQTNPKRTKRFPTYEAAKAAFDKAGNSDGVKTKIIRRENCFDLVFKELVQTKKQ